MMVIVMFWRQKQVNLRDYIKTKNGYYKEGKYTSGLSWNDKIFKVECNNDYIYVDICETDNTVTPFLTLEDFLNQFNRIDLEDNGEDGFFYNEYCGRNGEIQKLEIRDCYYGLD